MADNESFIEQVIRQGISECPEQAAADMLMLMRRNAYLEEEIDRLRRELGAHADHRLGQPAL